jgi:NADPH2:quinone reductase
MSNKIVQRRFGGPEVLEFVTVESPTSANLAEDEVLVRVAFAGVNPIDVMTRRGGGMAAAGIVSLPLTPGWDLAGTVEAVGSEVHEFGIGQRVYGMARFPKAGSAYAQQAVVPALDLLATPDAFSDEEAAAFPMAALTAWQALRDTASVQPGERVLITGAGGGVGHLAVQLAHHLGAEVITVASAGKHPWLQQLGADVTVDYTDPNALSALRGNPVQVALNLASGSRDAAGLFPGYRDGSRVPWCRRRDRRRRKNRHPR